MKKLRSLISAALLIAGLAPAIAQTFPTVPSSTVIGRTAAGVGPAQAIPFSQLLSSMLVSPLTVSQVNVNSVVYAGATSGSATVSAQAVAGTTAVKWPTVSGTVVTSATLPLVENAVTGTVSCPNCAIAISTRTAAAAQDLSAYSLVRTLGYDAVGDGGGATFKNVSTTPFLDSRILTGSLTAGGSGYVDGTYLYAELSGGTGTYGIASITVAGGAVTAVTIRNTGGNGYSVGDVLSANNAYLGGTGSGFTWTVSTISTPTASFTDSAGTHWQIVPDEGNFINVRQFGAKVDYVGSDASATNDYTAIQNAWNYAGRIHSPTIDGGGSAGAKVIHPAGNSLVCGSVPLLVPNGVSVEGHNAWASTLKMCAAWSNAQHFMTICDPNLHTACFASRPHNITLYSPFLQASSSAVSMVYSNNIQQIDVFDRVSIYAGGRRCISLETGYGGAALLGMQNVECTPGGATVNTGIFINYGTTIVTMRNVHVETGGPLTLSGITITGGFIHLTGFHTEGISTGVEANITGSIANGFVKLEDMTGGASCTNLVLKQGGSVANSVYVSSLTQNGCTNSMNNGGVLTAAFIGAWTLF